jgi:hypothetical protein
MKKILLIVGLIAGIVSGINAQSNAEDDCYTKWTKKFEERGAEAVADGTYPDVIVTIRNKKTNSIECLVGKCDVKGGKVIAMYLKRSDGKYEPLVRKPAYQQEITINNGLSKAYMTIDDEAINILFTKKLKPKKAEFQKAPDPDEE